jgi:hypothetical protein
MVTIRADCRAPLRLWVCWRISRGTLSRGDITRKGQSPISIMCNDPTAMTRLHKNAFADLLVQQIAPIATLILLEFLVQLLRFSGAAAY